MKKLLFGLFIFIFSVSFAQDKLSYSLIVKVDSLTKKEVLFDRVSNRMASLYGSNFKYEKDVIISDRNQGIIKLKFSKPYHKGDAFSNVAGDIFFTMTFLFKDGKSKIDLSDFEHVGNASMGVILNTEDYPYSNYKMFKGTMNKNWKNLRAYLDESKDSLLDLGESIVKKPGEAENNNW
ncbi:protein of unknown function [Chryseobacterium sp. RU37D]|uniref:DUF4468 domain-containing protein n=1 Tax=Chryseobacterium sp. RU37D TaxID=1907397 RepID=UPI000954AAA4|nr:DUF4468 domain-containing protein [Chryseobacterium sp. RU37D]SIR03422.1 protein of unknown function [Chryseobacterium sp. RU37D]